MMTGGKVIVTYKRKRPPPKLAYKRRRLPLRDELHWKNESSDLNLVQTSIEPKVEQTATNKWECPIKGSKHAPEEKGHLHGSMKVELSRLAVAESFASKSENKNQIIPNLMQLVVEPLAVLETNPGLSLKEDGLSVKDEASSLCINFATKRKLDTLLYTYQRRCKRKKDVNELQVQHGLGMNLDGPLESKSSIFTQESTESKNCSEHPLVACKNPESSCPGARSSFGSECFKPVADKKMEYIQSVDTSSVDINTQIPELSPCPLDENFALELQEDLLGNSSNDYTADPSLDTSNNATFDCALEPVNSSLERQEDMLLGNSFNNATVGPALEPVSSSPDFQEGPLGNTSNNASAIYPTLQFPEGPLGKSSNNSFVNPALEAVSSGLELQEVPSGNTLNDTVLELPEGPLGNNATIEPALEPVNSGLEGQEGQEGSLTNSSNKATGDPVLGPVSSGPELPEGPLGNTSNNAGSIDPVLEFPVGPLGNSLNNATTIPALEPVNSGLEFQEGPPGNLANCATADPSLEPVNSHLDFQEGPLGNLSNCAAVDPVDVTVDGLEFQEGPLGNSSDNASVEPVLEPSNSGVEFQEGPLANSSDYATIDPALVLQEGLLGNSLNKASVGPALEPVLFNKHPSAGEESPVLSGDAPNIGVTHEIPCSFQKEPLDLTVPPPGACENPLCISLDMPLGEHRALLSDESPGVKRFDLFHENKPEAADGRSHQELSNSSPAGTSKSSYLQLFPEDRMDELSRSTKTHKRDTAGSSSRENTVNPSETFGHDRTAEAKSSLYGIYMPMEAVNDGHKYDSASPQWPIGGTQYRDFLRDGPSKDFPGQLSASRRRILANRARTPKQHRLSPSSLYGYPTMWSEEELDSLWIGVRRYGRGNWEVMLRDPRLAFAPLRTPWDLALQWEQEQSKLLNNIPSAEGRHFRQSTVFQGLIGRQHLAEGVNLSLGDVYSGASLQTTTSMRPTQDAECSVSANSSTGRNCPHWLKEVVALPEDTAAVRDRGNRAETRGPGAGELIVIDSDASSEETISDHRGGKV